jgi:hypothetical protein
LFGYIARIRANLAAYRASNKATSKLIAEPAVEPIAEEPVAEKPVAEKPVAEKPVAEKPVAEEPAVEPIAEKPAVEPIAEKPIAEPVAEEPAAKKPIIKETIEVIILPIGDDGLSFEEASEVAKALKANVEPLEPPKIKRDQNSVRFKTNVTGPRLKIGDGRLLPVLSEQTDYGRLTFRGPVRQAKHLKTISGAFRSAAKKVSRTPDAATQLAGLLTDAAKTVRIVGKEFNRDKVKEIRLATRNIQRRSKFLERDAPTSVGHLLDESEDDEA